jgi:hypothetical protein
MVGALIGVITGAPTRNTRPATTSTPGVQCWATSAVTKRRSFDVIGVDARAEWSPATSVAAASPGRIGSVAERASWTSLVPNAPPPAGFLFPNDSFFFHATRPTWWSDVCLVLLMCFCSPVLRTVTPAFLFHQTLFAEFHSSNTHEMGLLPPSIHPTATEKDDDDGGPAFCTKMLHLYEPDQAHLMMTDEWFGVGPVKVHPSSSIVALDALAAAFSAFPASCSHGTIVVSSSQPITCLVSFALEWHSYSRRPWTPDRWIQISQSDPEGHPGRLRSELWAAVEHAIEWNRTLSVSGDSVTRGVDDRVGDRVRARNPQTHIVLVSGVCKRPKELFSGELVDAVVLHPGIDTGSFAASADLKVDIGMRWWIAPVQEDELHLWTGSRECARSIVGGIQRAKEWKEVRHVADSLGWTHKTESRGTMTLQLCATLLSWIQTRVHFLVSCPTVYVWSDDEEARVSAVHVSIQALPMTEESAKVIRVSGAEPGARDNVCPVCGIVAHHKCSVWQKTWYCSAEHQRQDWIHHRPVCRRRGQRIATKPFSPPLPG